MYTYMYIHVCIYIYVYTYMYTCNDTMYIMIVNIVIMNIMIIRFDKREPYQEMGDPIWFKIHFFVFSWLRKQPSGW